MEPALSPQPGAGEAAPPLPFPARSSLLETWGHQPVRGGSGALGRAGKARAALLPRVTVAEIPGWRIPSSTGALPLSSRLRVCAQAAQPRALSDKGSKLPQDSACFCLRIVPTQGAEEPKTL